MPLIVLLALVVGAVLPLQAGINAQLRTGVGHPVTAALVSFLVGTAALALYLVVLRPALPAFPALARVPWWHWTGGLLGALYVVTAVIVAPRLGATALIALVVAGQLLTSLALDHFGLVGYERRPVDLTRIAGVGLLFVGMLLAIRR